MIVLRDIPSFLKPNKRCVGWYESLTLDHHLLEYQVVKDINRASIINQDSVSVVVPYLNTNNNCIAVWVWRCKASSSENLIIGLLTRAIFEMTLVSWTF